MRAEPRKRGETLALVRKALRENPGGMSAKEIAAATGIEYEICSAQLSNFRGAGYIESVGNRPRMKWYLAGAVAVPRQASPTNVAGSIFDSRPGSKTVLMSPGSSRVLASTECFVPPDDFSPGAFMADWRRRTWRTDEAK